jgi:hypothetical protein
VAIQQNIHSIHPHARLLRALAQELRLPFLQIARKSELMRLTQDKAGLKDIEITADAALKLIDSYLFSTQLLLGQQQLELQPVSVSATMYDTAQYLHKMAKLYDRTIDIRVKGKCGLVMAHPQGLQAAFTSLAYTFINTASTAKKQRIVLTAQKTPEGVAAGVIATNVGLSKDTLSNARDLYGEARQPMAEVTHTTGAGIYVADMLFSAMAATMQVSKQYSASGLIATLLPSQQLSLL